MNIGNRQLYLIEKTEIGSADAIAHYTNRIGALKILASRRFRLSPIGNVNDIGEARAPIIGFPELPDEFAEYEPHFQIALRSWFRKEFARRVQIGCFSKRRSEGEIRSLMHSCVGSVLLWAFYADRGRGAALIFDRNALEACMQSSLGHHPNKAGEVAYWGTFKRAGAFHELDPLPTSAIGITANAIEAAKDAIWGQLMDDVSPLLFAKDRLWEWEKEFRIVGIASPDNRLHLNLEMHQPLMAVVLGPNWDVKSAEGVRCLEALDVPIFRICQAEDGSLQLLWLRESKPPSAPTNFTE